MIRIENMSQEEIKALLMRVGFGHLGCARDGHPYVVPMHYAFDCNDLYFMTTEGTKTEFMAASSEVCFQVEEIEDSSTWQSVLVTGKAERMITEDEKVKAVTILKERNPTLTPALSMTKIGAWNRLTNEVIIRIRPQALYGRKTA